MKELLSVQFLNKLVMHKKLLCFFLSLIIGKINSREIAYVTNSGSGSNLSVINVTQGVVTSTIPVGSFANYVIFTQRGNLAYVVNSSSANVTVIDVTSGVPTATIAVGANASKAAFTPDAAKAYVTNGGAGNVSVIDVASGAVIGTITVGSGPSGVAFTPDGLLAYVTNSGNNNLSVIDATTDTVTGTITTGSFPFNVLFTPDGNTAYVANFTSANVSVIDVGTGIKTSTISVGTNPRSLAIFPDGNTIYVANNGTQNVSVIDVGTGTVTSTISSVATPVEIAINPDGTISYATNGVIPGFVSVIDVGSGTVSGTIAVGNSPRGVAFTIPIDYIWGVDADGSWNTTTNWNPNAVPNGSFLALFSDAITAPRTITIDSSVQMEDLRFDSANSYLVAANSGQSLTLTSSPTISIQSGSHEMSAPIILSDDLTVSYDALTTLTLSGAVSGSGQMTKNSAGTLILTGSNSYTGGTLVSDGILQGNASGIQGAVTNNASVIFDQSTTGTYAGVMSGTGTLAKQNTGTLILTGNNTYSGGTVVSAGTLQGTTSSLQGSITNNAALVFDQSTTGTYAGVISGTGTLAKQNTGTVTLSNTSGYTGNTIVSGGILNVLGDISASSLLTVESGGTLRGTGTVGPTTVNSGGTLHGGASIGTITVQGDLTLSSGGNVIAEITPSGQSTLYDVQGDAFLNNATLTVSPEDGAYTEGSTYTILTTTGSVNGLFSFSYVDSFLTIGINYFPNFVELFIERAFYGLNTANLSGNTLITANYLNSLIDSPSMFEVLASLRRLSVADLPAAINAIDPLEISSSRFTSLNNLLFLNETVFSRLSNVRLSQNFPSTLLQGDSLTIAQSNFKPILFCDRTLEEEEPPLYAPTECSLWAQGFGQWSRQEGKDTNPSFDVSTGGFFAALDARRNRFILGGGSGRFN